MSAHDPPPAPEPNNQDLADRLRMELRRGMLTLAVLSALRFEAYAYSLRKRLQTAGIDIEEGTLYPLVRRLEQQGLLSSRWSEGEGRERRYYQISSLGKAILNELTGEWQASIESLKTLEETS